MILRQCCEAVYDRKFLNADSHDLKPTDTDFYDGSSRSGSVARRAFNEHRADVRSFGGNGHDHREYDYRGG